MSKPFLFIMLSLVLAGALVSIGNQDGRVSLESVRAVWSDVLRDADNAGLQVTRVSPEEEMSLGDRIAGEVLRWNKENADESRYVSAVAAPLVEHVNRKAIHYTFHVVESPQINAFALPGGHVFVYTGMLGFVQSEAELAAIVGHEIAHVDQRHCIEHLQYELVARKIGLRQIGGFLTSLAHSLVEIGYHQDEETEADLAGERMTIEAGYDPGAAAATFERLALKMGERRGTKAKGPLDETAQATASLFESYFRSHPPSEARALQLKAMEARNASELKGRRFYRGVRALKERVAMRERAFPDESLVYGR